jgi:general L-amino acid transport system permease protein
MTDGFTTDAIRPAVDGRNLPMATSIDLGYRGNHTLNDFIRLYVGQFFDVVKLPVLMLVGAGALGYIGARVADRSLSPKEKPRKTSRRATTWLIIALPIVMFGLVYGVGSILPLTDTRRWGGLLLTIMLTLVGIVASFPLGVLLALGRRSSLPVISAASTLYIEFVRGVPLITVLFMAQLLVPLVNPSLAELPNVFRAMIAIVLFTAAYLAENIRGGLQSIPHGQEEAAKALGLSSLQITMSITLPQALRAVLPALVGMVISVFKDTSLVTIVGLLDLTGMAQNIVSQTEFIGLRRETLLFITLMYFVISYVIAAVSRRIEASGSGMARLRGI